MLILLELLQVAFELLTGRVVIGFSALELKRQITEQQINAPVPLNVDKADALLKGDLF